MDSVLRWNAPCEECSSAWGADWCGHEEVVEAYSSPSESVYVGGSDLGVAVTSSSPNSLVIGKNENYVR